MAIDKIAYDKELFVSEQLWANLFSKYFFFHPSLLSIVFVFICYCLFINLFGILFVCLLVSFILFSLNVVL